MIHNQHQRLVVKKLCTIVAENSVFLFTDYISNGRYQFSYNSNGQNILNVKVVELRVEKTNYLVLRQIWGKYR